MHISIGQPSTESTYATFRCAKGHEMVSDQPITFGWYGDIDRGPPVCPHCLVEFVRTQFPMQRMTPVAPPPMMVPGILALAEGPSILRPTVLAGPCKTPGCILVTHPGNPDGWERWVPMLKMDKLTICPPQEAERSGEQQELDKTTAASTPPDDDIPF